MVKYKKTMRKKEYIHRVTVPRRIVAVGKVYGFSQPDC